MSEITTTAELNGELLSELESHAARFSPFYQGYLSDHGPMAALALHGLGRSADEVFNWLGRYRKRLEPLSAAPPEYRQLLLEMTSELKLLGRDELLKQRLPELISGWPTNAYHPLIRLAYGYQFEVDEEIAAGLAYLKWCGRRPALEALADQATQSTADPATLFQAMSACADGVSDTRRFDDCLNTVECHPEFRTAAVRLPNPLRETSRLALQVFAESHDFFALHLVTGAHAYRVLSRFAGDQQGEFFILGILAGYASVGAPEFTPESAEEVVAPSTEQRQQLIASLARDDEHDIKIAHSCLCQSEHFNDARYIEVASRYLQSR